jgi:hypothetical protein
MHAYIHEDKGQRDAGRSIAKDKDFYGPQRRDTSSRFYTAKLTVVKDEYWYVIVVVISNVANVFIIAETAEHYMCEELSMEC